MISAFAPLERFHFTCSADILVCGFWRLSSRQFIVENTGVESPRYIINGSALVARSVRRDAKHRTPEACAPPYAVDSLKNQMVPRSRCSFGLRTLFLLRTRSPVYHQI